MSSARIGMVNVIAGVLVLVSVKPALSGEWGSRHAAVIVGWGNDWSNEQFDYAEQHHFFGSVHASLTRGCSGALNFPPGSCVGALPNWFCWGGGDAIASYKSVRASAKGEATGIHTVGSGTAGARSGDNLTAISPFHSPGTALTVWVDLTFDGSLSGNSSAPVGVPDPSSFFSHIVFDLIHEDYTEIHREWRMGSDPSIPDVPFVPQQILVPLVFINFQQSTVEMAVAVGGGGRSGINWDTGGNDGYHAKAQASFGGAWVEFNPGELAGPPPQPSPFLGVRWGGVVLVTDQLGNPVSNYTLTDQYGRDWTTPAPICEADISPLGGDAQVNIDDLVQVITHWGACADCVADCAPPGGNGVVDIDDLVEVITHWGFCVGAEPPLPVERACCLPIEPWCTYVAPADCVTLGGTPQGAGTTCINTDCPTPREVCVNLTNIDVSVPQGQNAANRTFDVHNCGIGGTLNYTITADQSWLQVAPNTGTATTETDTITVSFNSASLTVGPHVCTITISNDAEPADSDTIQVNLTVSTADACVSPPSMNVGVAIGQNPADQTIFVWNCGTGTLNYTIADDQSWLQVTPTTGTATTESDSITVSFNTASLPFGSYGATITISNDANPADVETIQVNLVVSAAQVCVDVQSMDVTGEELQNAPSQTFHVSNCGEGTLTYYITDSDEWLLQTPSVGTATTESDTITVSFFTANFPPGFYSATVRVNNADIPGELVSFPVNLTVEAQPPQPEDAVIDADIPVSNLVVNGNVISGPAATLINTYLQTATNNVVFERLGEMVTGGNPSNRVSFLEHRWSINVSPNGTTRTLFIDAYHTANSEGDYFILDYSTDGVNFLPIMNITKTTYDGLYETASLPPTLSGPVILRIRDANRTPGNAGVDLLSIDHLYIRSQ